MMPRKGYIFLCFLATLSSQTAFRSAGKLQLHEPSDHTLAGQTDVYEVQLGAGQFLHVVAVERDVKLVLRIFDARGNTLATATTPPGHFGPVAISFVPTEAGAYRLNVFQHPLDKRPGGHYRIEATDLRAPSSPDLRRVEAERATFAGITENNERAAIAYLARAVDLWSGLDDPYQEALCWFWKAHYLAQQNAMKESLAAYEKALPLWQTLGEQTYEAESLNRLGSLYSDLLDKSKALDCQRKARILWHDLQNPANEAQTLLSLGNLFMSTGDNRSAEASFKKASEIEHALGSQLGEATALNDLGMLHLQKSEREQALDIFVNLVLPKVRGVKDPVFEAKTLNNIASTYSDLGRKREALDNYLDILKLPHIQETEIAMVQNNLADLYNDLGDKRLALKYYLGALEKVQALHNRTREAVTLNNIAGIYAALGERRQALAYYDKLLPVWQQARMRSEEAATLNDMGTAHLGLREYEKALKRLVEALSIRRAMEDRAGEVLSLNGIGEAYIGLGQRDKAFLNLANALQLARVVSEPAHQAAVLNSLRNYWESENNRRVAILFAKQAVNQYQLLRQNIKTLDPGLQRTYLTSVTHNYRKLAELLVAEGRLPEAERVLSLLKEQELRQYTRGVDLGMETQLTLSPDEVEAESITTEALEWLNLQEKEERSASEQSRLQALTAKLNVANDVMTGYHRKLEQTLAKQAPGQARQVRLETSDSQSLLRDLPKRHPTVAVYTLVLDDELDLIVVTPSVMVPHILPVKRADLIRMAEALLAVLRQPGSDPRQAAGELYEKIVAPIATDLKGTKADTILWSLDDVLRYIPMNALYNGVSKRYLVQDYGNVLLNSANRSRLKDTPQLSRWTASGFGISKQYFAELPQLDGVPQELNAVVRDSNLSASHGPVPGNILLDDAFTERSLGEQLSQKHPLIHIASHFVLDPASDDNSWLLVSGKETGGTGYKLKLTELNRDAKLDFHAVELLTLSACETAVTSSSTDGREVDSLGLIAQRKGAKAVVATLWRVDDARASRLMADFYRLWTNSQTLRKIDALRQAQVDMLDGDHPHPYYWAPFILMGNWQ